MVTSVSYTHLDVYKRQVLKITKCKIENNKALGTDRGTGGGIVVGSYMGSYYDKTLKKNVPVSYTHLPLVAIAIIVIVRTLGFLVSKMVIHFSLHHFFDGPRCV